MDACFVDPEVKCETLGRSPRPTCDWRVLERQYGRHVSTGRRMPPVRQSVVATSIRLRFVSLMPVTPAMLCERRASNVLSMQMREFQVLESGKGVLF